MIYKFCAFNHQGPSKSPPHDVLESNMSDKEIMIDFERVILLEEAIA